MIYLIIGHRGVGKTLWLKKLKKIFTDSSILDPKDRQVFFVDLDEEIERGTGKKVSELLSDTNGGLVHEQIKTKKRHVLSIEKQKYFRLIERDALFELIGKYRNTKDLVFISVGAGFKWPIGEKVPSCCHIIHLIRETDSKGRVFLDRPRLKVNKTPYEEYMLLYPEREEFYKKIRDESFVLPEQGFDFAEPENYLFDLKKQSIDAIITLNRCSLPSHFEKWSGFINKRISWGIRFFELRDDQLDYKELDFLMKVIPKEKLLLSFRKSGDSFFMEKDLSSLAWDWPVEKGPPPFLPPVISLHERRGKTFHQLCKHILKYKAKHFKLAVPVNSFEELRQGHLWFLENPENRSFLPISTAEGPSLWRWYRQIFGPQMKMHFIRESQEGICDQPFLYEHLLALSSKQRCPVSFAVVLGDPIVHSFSPAFHKRFFEERKMVFTKIPMKEVDFTRENLYILKNLGLNFAAVTSPLKKKAFQICDIVDSYAKSVQSVNTMVFNGQKWCGSNMDGYGLRTMLRKARINSSRLEENQGHIAIWGGGGTKRVLEREIPYATFYSARTGRIRSQIKTSPGLKMDVRIVIWAVGRARMSVCVFPPVSWKPQLVLDLNYTEDSPGREYALLVGADYISGKLMFECQAKKQQDFFFKIAEHRGKKKVKNGVSIHGS